MPADPLVSAYDSAAYGQPDLMAQAEQIARRKAVIQQQVLDSARQAGVFAQPPMPSQNPGFRSAVTGTDIIGSQPKASLAGSLTPLFAQFRANADSATVDDDVSGFNRRQQAAAMQHMRAMPPLDAPPQVRMQWAQAGANIPSLAPVMQDYARDTLINAPTRDAAQKWERVKFDAGEADRAATRTETARHNKATEEQGHYAVSQDGSVVVNTRTGDPRFTGVPTKETQKANEADRKVVQDSTYAVDNVIPRVKELLKNTTGGLVNTIGDAIDRAQDKTTPRMAAASSLKQLGGQLTSLVPRFEGPQSDTDVRYYKEQAANVGDTTLTTGERAAALEEVERMHRTKIGLAGARIEGRSQSQQSQQATPLRPGTERVPGSSMLVQPRQDTPSAAALIQQWREASPDRKGLVEQQMLSQGMVYRGHTYQGGDPSSPSSWSK